MKRSRFLLIMVSIQCISVVGTLCPSDATLSSKTLATIGHQVLIVSGAILTCILTLGSLLGKHPRRLSAITALFTAVSTGTLVQNLKRENKFRNLKDELGISY